MPDAGARRYLVKILPAAQRDLDDLDPSVLARLAPDLQALGANPRPRGCLKLTGEEGYRVRVGSYRVLYRIDDPAQVVFVYRIKHRRDAYRH